MCSTVLPAFHIFHFWCFHVFIQVLGFLDDDALTAALMRARTFVSPIRSSTGLNTKNVLALEHGK